MGPVQRLPKYSLLLKDFFKELSKYMDTPIGKQQTVACCLAQSAIDKCLNRIDESMNINDIVDCFDVKTFIKFICFYLSINIEI